MGAGTLYHSESQPGRDERTGLPVRQITSHPSIHHHPFYYLPAYDDAVRMLFFVSHRTGRPEIFAELRDGPAAGKLLQITDHDALSEWSVHPSPDGRWVYFTDRSGAWRARTEGGFGEECLMELGSESIRKEGMVGSAMGTTSVSRCGRWWAVPVKFGKASRLVIVDTHSGHHGVILERDDIGHPEFHPHDPGLLRYAGPYHSRMWVINRDGSGNRLVYERDAARKQWIVHETWNPLPGRRELLTADWPHGVIGVDIDSCNVRRVTTVNAWHPMVSRDGTRMVADTNFPDIGLQMFDPRPGRGQPRTLCYPQASSRGDHWAIGHCPYDDGPIKVYAPQHTHPHPNFSPDGSRVVFTSDRSGHSQVYEVTIPQNVGEKS